MHSRCSVLPFLLSLILPGRRRTKPPDALPCGRCPVCVAPRAPLWVYNCGPSSCRSCMPCKMSRIVFTASARLPCGSLLRPSRPSQYGYRLHNSRLSCCSCCPQTPTKLLGSQPVLRHCVHHVPCCWWSSGACFAQLIILLISGMLQ